MKNERKMSVKFVSLFMAVVTTVTLGGCNVAINTQEAGDKQPEQAKEEISLIEAEYPLYFRSTDDKSMVKLYFTDENKEIPYIGSDTVKDILERVYHEVNGDGEFALTVSKDGSVTTFTRENRYPMEIDPENDTIKFVDYDAFFMPSWSDTIIDVLEHYGTINCLQGDKERSYSRYGSEVDFDLAKYGIDIIEKDGECYIPMQTLSDIALSITCYVNLIYNGEAVFLYEDGMTEDTEFISKIYDAKTGKRSGKLADFTYDVLCLVMDYFYGLKELHGIKEFDDYFVETGLKYGLLSEDPDESGKAFFDLMFLYLADLHSAYKNASYLAGADKNYGSSVGDYGSSIISHISEKARFARARQDAYPDGIPGYEEFGNTAYITFDTFETLEEGRDYYKDPPAADTKDTVGLFLYAFSQITRKDSPIENVVMDLSVNGGGDSTTASFILSMMLGRASLCVEDTMTGAYANESFRADANLDGKFDEEDSLAGYNLYCITSPCSFSCGNLVPSVLKNSNIVTMLGQTSGGGACIVMPLSLADGTLVQISGCRRLTYMKNGSVYDIDQGVEPDHYIGKPSSFYDRKSLTEFINGLR